MPDLLHEIRKDLEQLPLSREFVVLQKAWTYIPGGNELHYYHEDHPELDNKLRILQNYGLIRDITHTIRNANVKRYVFMEPLVRYLGA